MTNEDIELLERAAEALTREAVTVRFSRPWHKSIRGATTKHNGRYYIDLCAHPSRHCFGLSFFLHEVSHVSLKHVQDSDLPLSRPSAWPWNEHKSSKSRERAANETASTWFRIAKRLTSRRDWRSLLRALITLYEYE